MRLAGGPKTHTERERKCSWGGMFCCRASKLRRNVSVAHFQVEPCRCYVHAKKKKISKFGRVFFQVPNDTNSADCDACDAKESEEIVHPLQPLTKDEISKVSTIVRTDMADLGDNLCFEMIELLEPPKSFVRSFTDGEKFARAARVNVFRAGAIGVWALSVSIDEEKVLSKEHLATARPMIILEEFMVIEDAVKADPRFIEACKKRGIEDMSLVCVDPWSAGNFGVEGEVCCFGCL